MSEKRDSIEMKIDRIFTRMEIMQEIKKLLKEIKEMVEKMMKENIK